jgi:hypothetical protein
MPKIVPISSISKISTNSRGLVITNGNLIQNLNIHFLSFSLGIAGKKFLEKIAPSQVRGGDKKDGKKRNIFTRVKNALTITDILHNALYQSVEKNQRLKKNKENGIGTREKLYLKIQTQEREPKMLFQQRSKKFFCLVCYQPHFFIYGINFVKKYK